MAGCSEPHTAMPSQSLDVPLLQEVVSRSANGGGKIVAGRSLLIGLVIAMLVSPMFVHCWGRPSLVMQAPGVTMVIGRLGFRSRARLGLLRPVGFAAGPQRPALLTMATQNEAGEPALEAAAKSPPVDTSHTEMMNLRNVRIKLLELANGFDRGLRASADDVRDIETATRALENCPGVRAVDWTNADDLTKLDGTWRLVYTSAFATGTLGGARPGPPSNGPLRLGKVLQRIQVDARRLDNIIEPLYLEPGFPPIVPTPLRPPPAATVELGHSLELVGTDSVRIIGDSTIIEPYGGLPLTFETPRLPFADEVRAVLPGPVQELIKRIESSTFRVVYLDDEVRVTRGDFGELRLFVRE